MKRRPVPERKFNDKAFHEALESWRDVPFDRVKANCCHFASDVVARATGLKVDIPHTENADDVKEYLQSQGSKTMYQHMRKLLGKPLPPLQAHIGYAVYRSPDAKGFVPGEATVGVVGRGCAWFLGPTGLKQVKLSQCTKAFQTYGRHG